VNGVTNGNVFLYPSELILSFNGMALRSLCDGSRELFRLLPITLTGFHVAAERCIAAQAHWRDAASLET